jgi:fibronectin-binding autotransporter adhesin
MVDVVVSKYAAFNRNPIRFHAYAILVLCLAAVSPDIARAANGTWTNASSGGLWSVAGNWSGGTIANAADATANFSVLNVTSNTVHLDSARTIGNLNFGDTTPGDIWTLDNNGVAANVLTLAVNSGTPSITVDPNINVSISTVLAGAKGLAKNGAGRLSLSNSNTYTGVTNINSGVLSVSKLTNGGISSGIGASTNGAANLVFNGGTLQYTGAGDSSNRSFTLTTLGGTIDASGSGAISFTAGTTLTSGTGNKVLTLTGSSVANNTLATAIMDGNGPTSLIKNGPGTWIISGANSYSGTTTVSAGVLVLGSSSALGGTNGVTNVLAGATLDLNAQSFLFSEQINISGTGVGGMGALVSNNVMQGFDNASRVTLNDNASIGGTGAWNFQGNNPTIDLAGFTLTKSGSNIIRLVDGTLKNTGGAMGTIEVSGGVFSIQGTTATVGSNGRIIYANGVPAQFGLSTGNFTWPMIFAGNNRIGDTSGTGSTLQNDLTLQGNVTFVPIANGAPNFTSNSPFTVKGNIGENGSHSISKQGLNTLTLSGLNSYTGPTNVEQGTLLLDFSAPSAPSVNIISSSSSLVLGGNAFGGGTLRVQGKASADSSQTFFDTTINAGASAIMAVNGAAGSATLSLGAITRNLGGTVDFNLPSSGSVSTTTLFLSNGVLTSAASSAGRAYATVNGVDWATLSGNNIASLPAAAYQLNPTPAIWQPSDNVSLSNNPSIALNDTVVNTLRITDSSAIAINDGQQFTVATGGILVAGSGTNSISGGHLSAGQNPELVIFQSNVAHPLLLNSTIADGAIPSSLTKSGTGTLILTAPNTYTGQTTVNSGILQVGVGGTAGKLGGGDLVVNGSLAFNHSDDVTLTSHISGYGEIQQLSNGVLRLVGQNQTAYSGSFTVYNGTLHLDFSGSSGPGDSFAQSNSNLLLGSSSAFGGGTFVLTGTPGASNSLSFGSARLGGGANRIIINQNGASNVQIDLNILSRSIFGDPPALVDFVLPSTGSIKNKIGTANFPFSGLYGTVNGVDWAAKDATNMKIVGGSSIPGFYTPTTATSLGIYTTNADVAVGVDTTLSFGASVGSLRFNSAQPTPRNVNLGGYIVYLGGVLETTNVGSKTMSIVGGELVSGNGADLVIIQNNTAGDLVIGSTIADTPGQTLVPLTKGGPGLLALTGLNTYTGPTYIYDGTIRVASLANGGAASGLGGSSNLASNLILNGAKLLFTGSSQSTDRLFTLGPLGATLENSGVGILTFSNAGPIAVPGTDISRTLTLSGSGQSILMPSLSDNANGITNLVKTGTGTWTLAGLNSYTGLTNISGGALLVNGAHTGGGNYAVGNGATLGGAGAISGAVTVSTGGRIAPGNAIGSSSNIGVLTVGPTTFNEGSLLNMELAGPSPPNYDQLHVQGALSLAGTFKVTLSNSFVPAAGEEFNFLDWTSVSGAFLALDLPTLASALTWDSSQLYNTGTLSIAPTFLRGDLDRNGQVTVADIRAMLIALTDLSSYALNNNLTPTQLTALADFDNSGSVTNGDLQGLLDLISNQGIGAVETVPEPCSIVLLAVGALVIVFFCRSRWPQFAVASGAENRKPIRPQESNVAIRQSCSLTGLPLI